MKWLNFYEIEGVLFFQNEGEEEASRLSWDGGSSVFIDKAKLNLKNLKVP